MSVGESNFCYGYALNLFEVMFLSPETATCKVNILCGFCFQNPVYLMFNEWTGLALQQDTRLQTLQSMPDVLGNIHTIAATLLTNDAGFCNFSLVIVGCHANLSLQYHKGLILVRMMMHRNKRAWFQGIEESVALVIEAQVVVIVLPQPRLLLGFLSQSVH